MPTAKVPEIFAREVIDVDLTDEARDSFMPYALSVIRARAIPDVRDGLKPVQRRILYGMSQLGLDPSGGHLKSAGVVGEVMGKYHPHGDSAIYETMVRMGQDAVAQVPLVDPRGNFGGLDDPPAAYRYTEARLSEAAMAMLDGIDQESVDFIDTFDGARQEPVVLPANLPNLLINGAAGIAVGVSTSIPPHNAEEVVKAVRIWLMSPEGKIPTLARLMKVLPGPDFPSGGLLSGDIKEAYTTGRGTLKLRAKCMVQKNGRRRQLVFDDLPYQVGPEKVIAEIRKVTDKKKKELVKGVAEVHNTSGPHGPQVTVVLTVGTSPETARDDLYARTSLANSVSVNAVSIVGGAPRTLGLREMIRLYADHLTEVTLRRAQFVREQAARRAHILRGLLAAVSLIDEVIAAIRSSEDSSTAREALMGLLSIDEDQAEAVLEMRLRRLNALEEGTLRKDLAGQEAVIEDRTEVIEDDKRLRSEAIKNMEDAAKNGTRPRRTEIE